MNLTAKQTTILYWVCNVVIFATISVGGVFDFMMPPQVVEGLQHLGYPQYFGRWLGIWKILGTIVLVANRPKRLKEWAYAGMVIDVTSASYSHFNSGDDAFHFLTPLAVLAAVLGSYFCWHKMEEAKGTAGSTHAKRRAA